MPGELELRIRVHGNRRVANKYRRLASRLASELDTEVGDWMHEKRDALEVKPYPPERPGQTYVRTYTLPTGWYVEKVRDAVYELGNWVEYAHWVVSQKFQAWMHKDRWWTAEEEITPSPVLTKRIMKKIKKYLK